MNYVALGARIQYSVQRLGCGLESWEFDPWQKQEILPFSQTTRPAVGSIQPPIQWIPGALSSGIMQLKLVVDHSPPSCAMVTNDGKLYLFSPSMT